MTSVIIVLGSVSKFYLETNFYWPKQTLQHCFVCTPLIMQLYTFFYEKSFNPSFSLMYIQLNGCENRRHSCAGTQAVINCLLAYSEMSLTNCRKKNISKARTTHVKTLNVERSARLVSEYECFHRVRLAAKIRSGEFSEKVFNLNLNTYTTVLKKL